MTIPPSTFATSSWRRRVPLGVGALFVPTSLLSHTLDLPLVDAKPAAVRGLRAAADPP